MRHFPLVALAVLLSLTLVTLAGVPLRAAEPAAVPTPTKLVAPPEALGPVARLLCDPVNGGDCLGRIALVSIALLFAFLTVVEVWQIQPPTTSLTAAGTQSAQASPPEQPGASAEAGATTPPVRKGRAILPASSLFSSNFSKTVLSGLGGLAVISVAGGDFWGLNDNSAQALFLVFFIGFFLSGLVLSAVVRGLDEAVRSRIVLRRMWPAMPVPKSSPRFLRFARWSGYWLRRSLAWFGSFRATAVVFIDTLFNVLQGKSQVQAALLSETITDHHEALLETAERVRYEVHQAVIRALLKPGELPRNLPHEERIRVAVSLLSSDEKEVYYIASERGSVPKPFGIYSVAWIAAHQAVARWVKLDKASENVYFGDHAVLWSNKKGEIPGPRGELLLKQYYQSRGEEDYKAFIVLPMPWCERGREAGHRRGLIHISFKEASFLEALWDGLEHAEVPNYDAWRGLLQTPDERKGGEHQTLSLKKEHAELGSVLFLALESLGEALSHFNDEVYDVYIQSRHHAAALAA